MIQEANAAVAVPVDSARASHPGFLSDTVES
jgi:hypothetical protein